jgi:hypothetical protein
MPKAAGDQKISGRQSANRSRTRAARSDSLPDHLRPFAEDHVGQETTVLVDESTLTGRITAYRWDGEHLWFTVDDDREVDLGLPGDPEPVPEDA